MISRLCITINTTFYTKLLFISLGLLFFYSSDVAAQSNPKVAEVLQEYRQQHAVSILENYMELLRIPNVASDISNMQKNAKAIIEAFEKRGASMELLSLPDKPNTPPAIYGELMTPGADRTLVIYVHYDGQPVDSTKWTHNPWTPVLYSDAMEQNGNPITLPSAGSEVNDDWRIYARSASDDKVPFPALLATLDALRESDIALTSNLKFFFDGEEEAGSPHLGGFLKKYKDKLQGDIWVFLDGPKHQSGRPQVVFGVRGVTGMEITVYGPQRGLHSGHYGGWAPVPGQILAELLASMKKETGEILIEEYYDSTAPITGADREAFATLPDYDHQIKKELGLGRTEFRTRSLMESYMYPTLTILGLRSGNVGELARNVIPTTATATIGMRLAKGNDPSAMQDLVEDHIRKQGFHIVRENPDTETLLAHEKVAKVTRASSGYPAVRTPIDNPFAQQIINTISDVSNEEIILYPTYGGSLPLFHFDRILGAPLIIVPIANHDNKQHAPDENIRIGNIWYGMDIYGSILTMD